MYGRPERPLEDDLVIVRYGIHPREKARSYARLIPPDEFEGGYTYRAGGLKLKPGDIVVVPPTAKRSTEDFATVFRVGSLYQGPTHKILRKHAHRFVTIKRCACGIEHE